MLEDKLVLWKLKNGDRDALRAVYEKYSGQLRTIAAAMLSDSGAAEDVLHDVFVSFAESVKHVQIRKGVKNYLIGCVVNKVRDQYRRRQVESIEADSSEMVSSAAGRPDSLVMADERSGVLAAAMGQLPLEQREVIVLHLNGGMKFKDVAKVQGVSVSTVFGRYKYGLEKLKTILDGELEK
ncbi:RNA polymerase sigma factor [Planctomycetota bacterium]